MSQSTQCLLSVVPLAIFVLLGSDHVIVIWNVKQREHLISSFTLLLVTTILIFWTWKIQSFKLKWWRRKKMWEEITFEILPYLVRVLCLLLVCLVLPFHMWFYLCFTLWNYQCICLVRAISPFLAIIWAHHHYHHCRHHHPHRWPPWPCVGQQ